MTSLFSRLNFDYISDHFLPKIIDKISTPEPTDMTIKKISLDILLEPFHKKEDSEEFANFNSHEISKEITFTSPLASRTAAVIKITQILYSTVLRALNDAEKVSSELESVNGPFCALETKISLTIDGFHKNIQARLNTHINQEDPSSLKYELEIASIPLESAPAA